MDVATYLQCFESSLSAYTGDDPLDPWDKFVEYLEQRLPADGSTGMSLVLDSLVQRFLGAERYADDIRYVNYCIKCARFYPEPIALYSHIYGKGVGTRTAALYLAWAQQFELKGMNDQADAVYQKAVENHAQPAESVLHEYRQFQTRTRGQTGASAGSQNPLHNSLLTNQMSSHREPAAHLKASVECLSKPPSSKTTIIVSRSETSGMISSGQSSGVQVVSAYMKEELKCEGSELCFEEVRATKYFCKMRERQEKEQREKKEKMLSEQKQGILSLQCMLEQVNQELEACGGLPSHLLSQQPKLPLVETTTTVNPNPPQQSVGRPHPSNRLSSRRSLGLSLHTQPTFTCESAAVPEPPQSQSCAGVPDTNIVSSELSQCASVRADHSSPEPRATSADQVRVVQTSVVQQSGGDEQTNLALPRPADGLCLDGQQQTATSHPGITTEPDEKLDVSHGGNRSHITPNSSLGFVQATPSRVLPSPTVNTREALDVIMDMFQAPTLLEDPFKITSAFHVAETAFHDGYIRNGDPSLLAKPVATAPFTIFQDDDDKENVSSASAVEKSKPIRALAEIQVTRPDKTNETPLDLAPDESTMWGIRYNSLHSLAACPNSTTDFAMLAQFVSTPFTHKTPINFFQDQDNCDGGDADDNAFTRRQPKKLSPIIEQSPLSETAVSQLAPSLATQGTIVGEGLAAAPHCLTTSSTLVQPPPPGLLSFRDQTLCPCDSSAPRAAGPTWEVHASPEKLPEPASLTPQRPESVVQIRQEAFTIMEDSGNSTYPEQAYKSTTNVPMSPECPLKPDWPSIRSPQVTVEPDLDAFLSPCRLKMRDTVPTKSLDVPMSPEQLHHDDPMSTVRPPQFGAVDEPMMSPGRDLWTSTNLSLQKCPGPVQLLSDPWDNGLISHLLSTVTPPLTSHPRCITWMRNIPTITPKMTISIGKASLRVDCVLGEGAFATVYQATDPETSEKMVLKVQKPANPWEFYINTQLDARLPPGVRHLYSSISSAHLFNNGSVLLGELHNYGTLLNAVNIYKGLSDKVMPQPLVIYFTICILHMVEQLHAIHIIHADIKPDNFMLGQRFLENKSFEAANVDHGLALIDLGQSIDMELFPEGTAFTARCLTSGFQCTEMLSRKPWNYQTDYFGIAATVYCMLFGTYMQVVNDGGVWRTNAVFRRNPHCDLWLDLFHTLLNVPDCRSLPSLRNLGHRLVSVLQQNYSSKLPSLKSRLVVLLLEGRKTGRR
ncbi:mitotic checkpoint serine/threonine-protein kinase BUB1 [Aulostomus maculatus]